MQPGLASDRIASAGPLSQILPVRQQRRCSTQTRKVSIPSGFSYALRGGIFGAVPVLVFGHPLFRCSASAHALRVGRGVGGPLPVGGPVCCRHALRCGLLLLFVVSASSPLSASYTINAPALLRSSWYPAIPRPMCVCSTLLLYAKRRDGHGDCNGPAVGLRSAAVICSCSHALPTLRKRYANALPVAVYTRYAGPRSSGSQGQRERQRQREMLRENVKVNLPCPVVRGQYMYGVRHKKSILGNGKSSFGNGKTH